VNLSKIFAISLIALLPAGCVTTQTVVSDFCQDSRIIKPSRKDTPDTLRQIATANARFRALCPE
jgi:hypothetical protein